MIYPWNLFSGILNMDNLASYLFDLIQNSIAAQAKNITCLIVEHDVLEITLDDDGKGMDHKTLSQVTSPFFTTRKTRRVGLGLSLIKMLADQTEGQFEMKSLLNVGTTLHVILNHHHIDMPPMGNLGETIVLISQIKDIDQFIFTYQKDQRSFTYDLNVYRNLLKETLYQIEVITYLQDYISQEINTVRENI